MINTCHLLFAVTVDLVRKRSEHNEGEISTLKELTLHQQKLDKIEHLDRWCRELEILLLQNNNISKIGKQIISL